MFFPEGVPRGSDVCVSEGVCSKETAVVFFSFFFWCQGRQTGNTATGIDLEID